MNNVKYLVAKESSGEIICLVRDTQTVNVNLTTSLTQGLCEHFDADVSIISITEPFSNMERNVRIKIVNEEMEMDYEDTITLTPAYLYDIRVS